MNLHALSAIVASIMLLGPASAGAAQSEYNRPAATPADLHGWHTQRLTNQWVTLEVVPAIGGRIIQFRLGAHPFLWVNPQLAGRPPTASGLDAEGGWLNYGGDKLWPAPQGWDNEEQWPGPPDAVLDGQPYAFEMLESPADQVAIRLTSRQDQRSGIQFSRVVRLGAGSSRVRFEATMKNIDTRPRRWGIWAHTQLDAGRANGPGHNPLLRAWCPVNPQSKYRQGYHVIFGAPDNPSFGTDWRRGLVRADYRYQVGKIGVDSPAGWVATVDGASGAVFVQRFRFEPDQEYPDGASVEFWHNGVGKIHAYNRDMEFPADPAENPFVFESEILSPFAELQPGESATWRYDWYAANIGGDYPVLQCTEFGVVADKLKLASVTAAVKQRQTPDGPVSRDVTAAAVVRGRFGVFQPGRARLQCLDAQGAPLHTEELSNPVSPLHPLVIDRQLSLPAKTRFVELALVDSAGSLLGVLDRVEQKPEPAPGQWPVERAWDWYAKQPWRVGGNFLPSTAVNDLEMWQTNTFDPTTIDRELGWAQSLGFNTVRVFVNFVVWQADPEGLKQRFEQFLRLADQHGIAVMPLLFDDCNFAGRVAAAGPQPDRVSGVHNSQWVSSPPLACVTDRNAWPELERYVKDMIGTFGNDPRVLIWDLYNEPGNSGLRDKSLPLVEAAFGWARAAQPTQPLTIGAWANFRDAMSRRIMELSDVISFHGYDTLPGLRRKIAICRTYDRPILCTEWLHRQSGNTVEAILPHFQAQRIGCYNWGLVAGRTQTFMPWGSKPGSPMPKVWQHDLFHADGAPYRAREVRFIRGLTGVLPPLQWQTLLPTAEKEPAPWRYTFKSPADDWRQPAFDDSAWPVGDAPFGREELPIHRKPNTLWTNSDIWLRREFVLTAPPPGNVALRLHHDEDAEVFLNGVPTMTASGFNAAYEVFDWSPAAQAALEPGTNVLAIHCRQTGGGQYLDAGLVAWSDPAANATNMLAVQPRSYLKQLTDVLRRKWPANRTVNIVCHGHSVPAGYFQTPVVDTFNAYPYLLHRELKARFPYAVINVIVTAIGGENAESGARRFARDVLAKRPDVVCIDYGLNDRGIGLPRAAAAWKTMITAALSNNVQVILLTPTGDLRARMHRPSDPLVQHAEQIRQLGREFNVPVVDSFLLFQRHVYEGGKLEDLMSQINHPNRRGHELVAKELLKWFP